MPKYRWRIVPIDRPIQLGHIWLQPAPPNDEGRSGCTGHLSFELEHYVDEDGVKAQALLQLELVSIAAAALGGSVREPVVDSTHLENREEIEGAGLRTPFSASLTLSWNVVAPTVPEDGLLKGDRAASSIRPDELLLWRRAARWLWKANGEQDPYDQMLALWISFSVVYGPYMKNGEQRAITDYVAHTVGTDSAARSVVSMITPEDLQRLGISGLILRRGRKLRPIADELRSALRLPAATQDPVQVVTLALLAIYAVRCAIVHQGNAAADRLEEVGLVWASAHALKAFMMFALRARLGV